MKKAIYAMVEGDCDEVGAKGLFPLEDCICSPLVSFESLEVMSSLPIYSFVFFFCPVKVRSEIKRCQRGWDSFNIPDAANT